MSGRIATATKLGFCEQARRPLLIVLLVGLPFFFITRAIAETVAEPRLVPLPGGEEVISTMREVHGANMAGITIAFLAGLCGLFIMQSAREADRRLIVAGFRPHEAVLPRLLVLCAATALVLAVSVAVTALTFQPEQWLPFVGANLVIGLLYGGIGALAGAAMGRLGGTYFMLFLPMLDLGVAQNPMFGDGRPDGWATVLPGYCPGRLLVDASFSGDLHAWGELALSLLWTAVVVAAVAVALTRALGLRGGPGPKRKPRRALREGERPVR